MKVEVVDLDRAIGDASVARGRAEHGPGGGTFRIDLDGRSRTGSFGGGGVGEATTGLLEALTADTDDLLSGVDAVGHRVVHGGAHFREPARLDGSALRAIADLEELAPLHNARALEGVQAAQSVLPGAPHVGVFDTAFFADLPETAATYALPRHLTERHGLRRFGFHGLSHAWLWQRYAQLRAAGGSDAAIVTLHLGSGCSAAAIRGGRPLDTSMGFTPLEGLVMATRSGDLDPGVVTFLARREAADLDDLDELLNRRSGLLGLGGSADVRELEQRARSGDRAADVALEIFAHRARKYVGAYLAVLGGAEALVFSGGIGENSPDVRRRICAGMEWCGFDVEARRNEAAIGREAPIGAGDGEARVWVIPTREERWIACETERALTSAPDRDDSTDLGISTEEPR